MQTTHTTFEYSSLNVLKAIYEERIYLMSKSLKGTLKGTSIDLNISDIPFSKELKAAHEKSQANPNGEGYGFISIELAPFYQRFYEDVPK